MTIALPSFRVGEPDHYRGLSVFPLFTDSIGHVEYSVAEEALAGGSATVEEVSETGSVPELLVHNRSDKLPFRVTGSPLRYCCRHVVMRTDIVTSSQLNAASEKLQKLSKKRLSLLV